MNPKTDETSPTQKQKGENSIEILDRHFCKPKKEKSLHSEKNQKKKKGKKIKKVKKGSRV